VPKFLEERLGLTVWLSPDPSVLGCLLRSGLGSLSHQKFLLLSFFLLYLGLIGAS
jgi:hypothetical protein